VTVTVAAAPGHGQLTVADTGPGMPGEQAARVFERFYRTDRSRGRASGGTGLGLSIVAALVAAHGGTVTVDTAPGRGAAFNVQLSLAAAAGDRAPRAAEHAGPVAAMPGPRAG
jgi:two-component system OmpR family sensor kinase